MLTTGKFILTWRISLILFPPLPMMQPIKSLDTDISSLKWWLAWWNVVPERSISFVNSSKLPVFSFEATLWETFCDCIAQSIATKEGKMTQNKMVSILSLVWINARKYFNWFEILPNDYSGSLSNGVGEILRIGIHSCLALIISNCYVEKLEINYTNNLNIYITLKPKQ